MPAIIGVVGRAQVAMSALSISMVVASAATVRKTAPAMS